MSIVSECTQSVSGQYGNPILSPAGNSTGVYLLFDMQGKMLKKLDAFPGDNDLTIRGSELQAGMYLYSLIADGKEVDTKRMILTK
jgi:hypothetical protein